MKKKLFFIVISILLVISIVSYLKDKVYSSAAYTSEEAVSRGDAINLHGNGVENLDKFVQFLKNVSDKEKDAIRITDYTDEGDPVYKDLKFDGKVIHYRYDNSNDKFAGNSRGVKKIKCSKIGGEEPKKGKVHYFIRGCSDDAIDSFLISVYNYELDKLSSR